MNLMAAQQVEPVLVQPAEGRDRAAAPEAAREGRGAEDLEGVQASSHQEVRDTKEFGKTRCVYT